MVCSIPICVMIERQTPDGSESFLLVPDLATALTDAARAETDGDWITLRIVLGRDAVLEGAALVEAVREAAKRLPV